MPDPAFLIRSVLFGIALAMDAFSVSVADGLNHPGMRGAHAMRIAGTFALFQVLMPLLGWLLVRSLVNAFTALASWTPWVAMGLLTILGLRMIASGLRDTARSQEPIATGTLLVQGVATSIDALSVGLAMAETAPALAALQAAIIGAVTFVICLLGVRIGRRIGARLVNGATILGGGILIVIGAEILIRGLAA